MGLALDEHARVRQVKLWALLSGVALLVLGNGLQGTLVGVRAGLEGMADEMIGVIMSAYFVGFIVGSVSAPRLIQHVGHIRAFAALASIASAVALAFALVVSPTFWVCLRALHGACYAGLIIVAESWINASTERSRRGRMLAIYSVTVYAAWAASQPLLDLAPSTSFVLFCLVSICLSLALVPITLSRAGVPGVVQASRLGLARLYKISPLGVVGAFTLGLAISAVFGMGPTFAQRIGLEETRIAAFLGMLLVGALAVQWPLGWLSDLVDRRLVIAGATLATSVSATGLALGAADGLASLLVLSFLLGGFGMPIYSLCVAHANDQVERPEVIAVASGLILVYGIGSMFGPFAASLLMVRLGPSGLFVFVAATTLAYALYGVHRVLRGPVIARERKESYVAVPQTSHASLPLHRHGSGKAEGKPAPR